MSDFTRRTFLAGTAGIGLAAHPLQAALQQSLRYAITDLGTLPGGDYSSAQAINNKGQIVGLSSTGKTIVSGLLRDTRAVLWHNGTVVDLVEKQFLAPSAFRINNRGQVLIQWQYIGTDTPGSVPPAEPYVALWDGSVKQVWRSKDNFLPIHLNDRGELAGYDTRWEWKAALWRDGKATLLPLPQDAQSSQATALNDSGMAAGNYRRRGTDGLYDLFTYDKGLGRKVSVVTSNAQHTDFLCAAINARGQAVGMFRAKDTRTAHLFAWHNGSLSDLGALGRNGNVHDVNNASDIVGQSDAGAFVYTKGALHDLNSLLPPDSGWNLWEATGINDAGQIVGTGILHGKTRAYLLTPQGQTLDHEETTT